MVFHNIFVEQMRKLEETEKARREAEEAAEAARREMEDREREGMLSLVYDAIQNIATKMLQNSR